MAETRTSSTYRRRNIGSGFLFGIGLVAFIDEAVFHQLLHWHHFYDRSTTAVGLVSDGLFHALSWFATIGGLFLFADLRRREALQLQAWLGAVLLGSGAFQLYDGVVHHKLMRIHQIRYVDNVLVYDWAWNIAAVLLIAGGWFLLIYSRRTRQS
ncbi:DUF2243 domain-containing protein [Paenibacillus tarimensis]|uniref:DUF2243 domain-containing protein n=1 Tax=Paenibacillus tarimensis TaxID=416012 RepID=UPI001F2CFDE1|nr:DUF2243 domain-containing protein [Paenibacillus tarimensis]MCF2941995.1 DUF2243 domain-containing protein [Paenibacillus tarimensis]